MPISLLFPFLLLLISSFTTPSTAATESLIFGGCSQLKFMRGSAYENSVNSLLTSLVNSATFSNYNNFTIPGTSNQDTVYGLFQCRGDLGNDQCSSCIAKAVSQLGTLCLDSFGGELQLEGCFVKYDNNTFVGVGDKTAVSKKCGPSMGWTLDALARRDAMLAYLGSVCNSGDVRGFAQCLGDLSPSECQDCLSDAIGRLKSECGPVAWGKMYLAKCYVRCSEGRDRSRCGNDDNNHNDDEIEKTLAILIGFIVGVALIIIFLYFLSRALSKALVKQGFFPIVVGKFPSPLFPIEIKNIQKAKHGSDSGVYGTEGRFVSSKFEEIFTKHAKTHPNALTSDELKAMLKANRQPKDYRGWLAGYTEWKILYVLCKDKNGLLHKETVRAVYDGSLFDRMEKEHSAEKKNN